MLVPIIEEIAKEFEDKVKVGKLNILENSKTADKYQIFTIPTIIIFKNGKEIERAIGLRSKEAIADKFNSLL